MRMRCRANPCTRTYICSSAKSFYYFPLNCFLLLSFSLSLSDNYSCFADCKCEGFAHCISIYMANLFRLALGNGRQTRPASHLSYSLSLSAHPLLLLCSALFKGLVMVLLYNCTCCCCCCCCCRRHETRNGRRKFVKLLAYLNLNEP